MADIASRDSAGKMPDLMDMMQIAWFHDILRDDGDPSTVLVSHTKRSGRWLHQAIACAERRERPAAGTVETREATRVQIEETMTWLAKRTRYAELIAGGSDHHEGLDLRTPLWEHETDSLNHKELDRISARASRATALLSGSTSPSLADPTPRLGPLRPLT